LPTSQILAPSIKLKIANGHLKFLAPIILIGYIVHNLIATAAPMSWQKTDAAPPAIFSKPNKPPASKGILKLLLFNQLSLKEKRHLPMSARITVGECSMIV